MPSLNIAGNKNLFKINILHENKKAKKLIRRFLTEIDFNFSKCHSKNYYINYILLCHHGNIDNWEYKNRKKDGRLMLDDKIMNWKLFQLWLQYSWIQKNWLCILCNLLCFQRNMNCISRTHTTSSSLFIKQKNALTDPVVHTKMNTS